MQREHFEKLFLKIRPVVDIDERHRRGAKCLGAVFKSCWRGPTPKRFMRCWDYIHISYIYIRWIEVCIYVYIYIHRSAYCVNFQYLRIFFVVPNYLQSDFDGCLPFRDCRMRVCGQVLIPDSERAERETAKA